MYFALLLFISSPTTYLCQSQTDPKIVGGFNCHPSRVPYFASVSIVWDKYRTLCGGSVLHSNWVLTAAHCFASIMHKGNCTVRTGLTEYKTSSFEQSSKVNRMIAMDEYFQDAKRDIGLLELVTPIKKNRFTAYARVVTPNIYTRLVKEQRCNASIVMGFGYRGLEYLNGTRPQGPNINNTILQCVFQWVKPESKCPSDYQICATGSPVQEMDACHGDSGGPLICEGFQIGIVSSGFGCGMGYAFYTKVARFYRFLQDHVPGLPDDRGSNLTSLISGKSHLIWILNAFFFVRCILFC